MIANRQDDKDRDKRERRHQEKALKNSFPVVRPVSVEQPTPPAAVRDRERVNNLKDDERDERATALRKP
jgi:hypothetical protein